jgi:hypothetical protein
MTSLALMVAVAVGVEKFLELFKQFIYAIPGLPDKFKPFTLQLISCGLGILLAFGANLDVFQISHIDFSIPYVGVIAAGLVIGRGSNAVHDLFSNVLPIVPTNVNTLVQPQETEQPKEDVQPVSNVPVQDEKKENPPIAVG